MACACGPNPSLGDDDDDTGGANVLDDSIEYYFGDSTAAGVVDDWVMTTTYLVRRSLFPQESRFTEELINIADGTTHFVTMDVDAAAGTLTLAFEDGSYTGTGTLTGDPWEWTGWQTTSTAQEDGSTVESTDTLSADELVVDKLGKDPSGADEWTAHEVFAVVAAAEWQQLRSQVP